jgi:hypothetical protein
VKALAEVVHDRIAMLRDIQHVQVDYAPDRYSGHPRQGGIFNFAPRNEIAVIYNRAACRYLEPADVRHDYHGYHGRAHQVLARSLDGGKTWDRQHDVIIFDETWPLEQRRAFLKQVETLPPPARDRINLASPDTAIFFGRTWAGEGHPPGMLAFALRSPDRGKTWESVPSPIHPPTDRGMILKDGHPLVQMPDGTQLGVMTHGPGVWLFGTDDDGITWDCIAQVCVDPTGFGRSTYAGLILLPSGRLQCYSLNIGGWRDAIQMNHSDDGGYAWSTPRPIVRWGQSPWASLRRSQSWAGADAFRKHYRSPWPLRLADGRLVVLFARRKPPFGIGVIVSENEGHTWSPEQILRNDASTPDLGYPVATEVSPGRIFTAYYMTLDDGNAFGGTRFIAGSHFLI